MIPKADIYYDLTDEQAEIGDFALELLSMLYHQGNQGSDQMTPLLFMAAIAHQTCVNRGQPVTDAQRAAMHATLDEWVTLSNKMQQRKNLQDQGVVNAMPI